MAITFIVIIAVMTVLTLIKPLKKPKVMPVRKEFDMKPTPSVLWLGLGVIAVTIVLYILFW